MMKRILKYIIPLVIYIFLPGIIQQIFMEYDDYYFYVIVAFLLVLNVLLALNILESLSKLFSYIIVAAIVTGLGVLSVVLVMSLNLGWDGIKIALLSNAVSSTLTWEVIFQLNQKKKTATNSGFSQ